MTVAELMAFGAYAVRLRRWLGITAGDTTHDDALEDYLSTAAAQADDILGRDDWEDELPRAVVVAVLQGTKVYWESRDVLEAQRNKLVEYAATADRCAQAMLPLLRPYQSAEAI